MSMKELSAKRFGRLKVLGFLGRWIPRNGFEKQDFYLCRCDCGRKLRVSKEELDSGVIHSCPNCVSLAPVPQAQPTWSSPMFISNEVTKELLLYFDRVPKWWWASLGTVVDEIINMMARGTYSDDYICKWFECPPEVLAIVRRNYGSRLSKVRKECKRLEKQFDYIEKIPAELIPAGRFMTIFKVALTKTTKRNGGNQYD